MRTLCLASALLLAPLLLSAAPALAQDGVRPERHIVFPDVPGYLTLVTDLHTHSVFSDGAVWPTIRVQEALRDGLDVLAITEHLEYQPHRDDIPHPDRNRAYDLASRAVGEDDSLIVVRGSEVTRRMPPGHINAIFIEDANPLLQDDSLAVLQEARRQGAFIFWNHPTWTGQTPDGIATLSGIHRQLIADSLLHGIEVVNEHTYSDEALQIALDHDLTILGTSDIHGLVDWAHQVHEGGHRPVTLVFAAERTEEALKDALLQGRTAVWFDNLLVGREALLQPLLQASLRLDDAIYRDDTSVLVVTLENHSDATFILRNQSPYTFYDAADIVTAPPHTSTRVIVKTGERLEAFDLSFEVLNAVTAPGQHPVLTIPITVSEGEEE